MTADELTSTLSAAGMKLCYGCRRVIPDYWAVGFTTRFRQRPGYAEMQPGKMPNWGPFRFADCGVCCDKVLPAYWGGYVDPAF